MEPSKEKKITLVEFRSWLQGVEEMQEDENWTPSAKQWARIREKIECLFEAAPQTAQPAQAVPTTAIRRESSPIRVQEAPVAAVPQSTLTSLPMQPAKLPEGLPFATGDTKTPVKAPSIDTSDGSYRSPFG